jgi:outer membrane receptor for ferrienterochelin and colicin
VRGKRRSHVPATSASETSPARQDAKARQIETEFKVKTDDNKQAKVKIGISRKSQERAKEMVKLMEQSMANKVSK